jgi:hypothetical protein
LADERKNSEEPPPHYEGGIPILPGPADREQAERAREKEYEREYKQAQTSLQRGIFITQVFLVFFGIIGAGVSYYQSTMARQAAEQAKRAADLASDAFDAAYGEHGVAERTMGQMVGQTAAGIKSANAAKKAADTARDAFTKGSRPWVGPIGSLTLTQPMLNQTQRNGDKILVVKNISDKFNLKNFGKDPALFVSSVTQIVEPSLVSDAAALTAQVAKTQLQACLNADKQAVSKAIPGQVVFPDDTSEFEELANGLARNIPVAQFDEKRDTGSDAPLMLAGCISYRDQFKVIHHTRTCFISNVPAIKLTTGSQLRICHSQQNAD